MSFARQLSKLGRLLSSSGLILPEALANGGAEFGSNNVLINGGLDVWQRATSFFNWGSFAYLVDRMRIGYDGTPANGRTLTRQPFIVGQTDVPEGDPQYYMEYTFPVCGTPTNYLRWDIEGARTFQGKKATFSFWARVPSGTMTIGMAIAQEFGSGGSPSGGVYPSQTNYTVTTTWKKFIYTQQMPSIAGKILGTNGDDRIWPGVWMPTNASGTIQFANFKLEEGDTATRFNRRLPGAEIALCERYFQKSYPQATVPGTAIAHTSGGCQNFWWAASAAGTLGGGGTALPVSMRAQPTVVIYDLAGSSSVVSVHNSGGTVVHGVTLNQAYATEKNVFARVYNSAYVGISYAYTLNAEL